MATNVHSAQTIKHPSTSNNFVQMWDNKYNVCIDFQKTNIEKIIKCSLQFTSSIRVENEHNFRNFVSIIYCYIFSNNLAFNNEIMLILIQNINS